MYYVYVCVCLCVGVCVCVCARACASILFYYVIMIPQIGIANFFIFP